jgi:hypothetical protein
MIFVMKTEDEKPTEADEQKLSFYRPDGRFPRMGEGQPRVWTLRVN